jgi:lysophospholipase L1-like esterase
LLPFWNAGGYWFDLPTSLVSSTASARALVPVGTPAIVNPSMGGNAAYQLNGTTQYFSLAALSAIIGSGKAFTIAVRARSNDLTFQALWGAGYEFTGASITGQVSGEFPILDSKDGLGGEIVRTSDYRVRFNDVCITWSYDGVSLTKIYVNGVLTGVTNGNVAIPATSPANLTTFCLGANLSSAANQLFNGFVKRGAVSDQVITDAQALGLYNAWGPATDITLPLAASPRILWIGDSITQGDFGQSAAGYRYLLEQTIIANRWSLNSIGQYFQGGMPNNQHGALGGSDLAVIQANFPQALLSGGTTPQSVKLVLFMGGTNNMAAGDVPAALAAYVSCLDSVWAQASALDPTVRIAVTTIPDEQTGNPGQTSIAPFNAGLPAIWASRSYASHLITWDAYAALGPWASGNYHDTTHPNPAGYTLLYSALLPAISSYLAALSPTH